LGGEKKVSTSKKDKAFLEKIKKTPGRTAFFGKRRKKERKLVNAKAPIKNFLCDDIAKRGDATNNKRQKWIKKKGGNGGSLTRNGKGGKKKGGSWIKSKESLGSMFRLGEGSFRKGEKNRRKEIDPFFAEPGALFSHAGEYKGGGGNLILDPARTRVST